MKQKTCPLCGREPTVFLHPCSVTAERPFVQQKCANLECGLPCRLWEQVELLQIRICFFTMSHQHQSAELVKWCHAFLWKEQEVYRLGTELVNAQIGLEEKPCTP